ncbi:MAG: thioesterase family protein [Pseudomonadota bacterium]
MTSLKLHSEPLQEAWLDAYGHLNEAYYLVPFTNATWKLQDHFGIGVPYFEETGCALYTLQSHLIYENEVRAPADLAVESVILDFKPKILRFGHIMSVGDKVAARFECLGLHYDTRSQRSAPFPETTLSAFQTAKLDPLPDWVGQSVGIH